MIWRDAAKCLETRDVDKLLDELLDEMLNKMHLSHSADGTVSGDNLIILYIGDALTEKGLKAMNLCQQTPPHAATQSLAGDPRIPRDPIVEQERGSGPSLGIPALLRIDALL